MASLTDIEAANKKSLRLTRKQGMHELTINDVSADVFANTEKGKLPRKGCDVTEPCKTGPNRFPLAVQHENETAEKLVRIIFKELEIEAIES